MILCELILAAGRRVRVMGWGLVGAAARGKPHGFRYKTGKPHGFRYGTVKRHGFRYNGPG
jgi:hypothetical protein